MDTSYPLSEIAGVLDAEIIGDPELEITSLVSLANLRPHTISFSVKPGYQDLIAGDKDSAKDSAIIVRKEDYVDCGVTSVICDDPYNAFAKLSHFFAQNARTPKSGIAESAVVAPSAQIAKSAYIGHHCVIGEDCVIGANAVIEAHCVIMDGASVGEGCILDPQVTLYPKSVLGKHVRIHSGTIIGSDGFGFSETAAKTWDKIEHLGHVVIGDNVDIGANCTIDRATLDTTVIGEGVIMDNLVQVAHNVHIGAHTAIAGMVAIGGSTRIGKYCKFAGMVAIAGHLEICDDVIVLGKSGVTKSIKEPGMYAGNPLRKNSEYLKSIAAVNALLKESKSKD